MFGYMPKLLKKCPECGETNITYDEYSECYNCPNCGEFWQNPENGKVYEVDEYGDIRLDLEIKPPIFIFRETGLSLGLF
jgi:transcription initiation factor IIE alpha subunit